MKKTTGAPKRHGEERERSDESEESLLSKILRRRPSVPKVPSIDIIKPDVKAFADEAKRDFEVALGQLGIVLKPGKEHKLSQMSDEYSDKQGKSEKPQVTQEFYEYTRSLTQTETRADQETNFQIKTQIEQILVELRGLKDSSEQLDAAFKDVVIDDIPEKPGIYHLTFFEGFLKMVIKMKDKVEDGVIFAQLFRSRKRERGYSQMAKKHGTSFTLHHDRTPATQTG